MLKVGEVAAILRVGRNQLYEAVARGDIRAIRIGRTIRIPKHVLLDLLTAAGPQGTVASGPQAVTVNLRFVAGKRVGVASSGRTDEEGLRG